MKLSAARGEKVTRVAAREKKNAAEEFRVKPSDKNMIKEYSC